MQKALVRVLILILMSVGFLFSTGCYLLPEEEVVLVPPLVVPQEVTYRVTSVERGDIVNSIVCTGNFVYVMKESLSFFKKRDIEGCLCQ